MCAHELDSSYLSNGRLHPVVIGSYNRELLHRGRRVGDVEKTKIRVVSEEANLILHIETYQL